MMMVSGPNAFQTNSHNYVHDYNGVANNHFDQTAVRSLNNVDAKIPFLAEQPVEADGRVAPAMGRMVGNTIHAISSGNPAARADVDSVTSVEGVKKSGQSAPLVAYGLTDTDIQTGFQHAYDSLKQFNPDIPSKINDSVDPAVFNTPYELKSAFDPKSASFLANNIIGMVGTIASLIAAPIGGAPGGIANAAAIAGKLGAAIAGVRTASHALNPAAAAAARVATSWGTTVSTSAGVLGGTGSMGTNVAGLIQSAGSEATQFAYNTALDNHASHASAVHELLLNAGGIRYGADVMEKQIDALRGAMQAYQSENAPLYHLYSLNSGQALAGRTDSLFRLLGADGTVGRLDYFPTPLPALPFQIANTVPGTARYDLAHPLINNPMTNGNVYNDIDAMLDNSSKTAVSTILSAITQNGREYSNVGQGITNSMSVVRNELDRFNSAYDRLSSLRASYSALVDDFNGRYGIGGSPAATIDGFMLLALDANRSPLARGHTFRVDRGHLPAGAYNAYVSGTNFNENELNGMLNKNELAKDLINGSAMQRMSENWFASGSVRLSIPRFTKQSDVLTPMDAMQQLGQTIVRRGMSYFNDRPEWQRDTINYLNDFANQVKTQNPEFFQNFLTSYRDLPAGKVDTTVHIPFQGGPHTHVQVSALDIYHAINSGNTEAFLKNTLSKIAALAPETGSYMTVLDPFDREKGTLLPFGH